MQLALEKVKAVVDGTLGADVIPVLQEAVGASVAGGGTPEVWRLVGAIAAAPPVSPLHQRLVRGVLLVARNLCVTDLGPLWELPFDTWLECDPVVYWQLVANACGAPPATGYSKVHRAVVALPVIPPEALHPLLVALSRVWGLAGAVPDALASGAATVVCRLQTTSTHQLAAPLVQVFTHESYSTWWLLHQQLESAVGLAHLLAARLVVTSDPPQDSHAITALLAWAVPLLEWAAQECQALPNPPALLHQWLVSTLDLLTGVADSETFRQFCSAYHTLRSLVAVLVSVDQHGHRSVLKERDNNALPLPTNTRVAGKVVFPHVKSLVVELMCSLVYESREAQEEVRTCGGLPAVLSCCVVDDHEPYLRERAIVLLRFLLTGNSENQAFVALLEAREAVDETALQEAGYTVEITDGKVGMKRRT